MLRGMKKINTAFVFACFFFFLFAARDVFAAPGCDPTKVDVSLAGGGKDCDSWTSTGSSTGSQTNCDSKNPGTIYCDAAPATGRGGSTTCCWPKGTTTKSPTCPPDFIDVSGYGKFQRCSTQPCCRGPKNLGLCTVGGDTNQSTGKDLITECGGGLTSDPDCNCVKQKGVFSEKNYCGSNVTYQYNSSKKICGQVATSSWELQNKCDNGTLGIQTAIGCVPTGDLTGPNGFLSFVLKWVFGISGGIILIMIIVTGYNILTSSGNPEKLQAAKENVVSIFSGLILIAFSLVLLQAIGAGILGLPTF